MEERITVLCHTKAMQTNLMRHGEDEYDHYKDFCITIFWN
jgi:hypothetical protein